MTKYDFETVPDRRNTDSVKWDIKDDQLPMWIADMDFKTAPEIIAAMQEKIKLGAFGYEWPKEDYFNSVKDWLKKRHHTESEISWMIFTTGVVPAISSIVRRCSQIGDNVLVQKPVYNIFNNSILNNGRHVLSSDLIFDGEKYHVNWADLEERMADPLTSLMIFCNPHNPIGKVWTHEEVQRIADLCLKHHVVLLSDEIHGDLVRDNASYTPTFSIEGKAKENVISLISPSKTFNVAALHAATGIVPGKHLRNVVNRGLNSDEVAEPNLLAIPGTIAAYEKGGLWLDQLLQVLENNFKYTREFLQKNLPQLKIVSGPATYLIWIDISSVASEAKDLTDFIAEKTGLIVTGGDVYGGDGKKFIRINLACPLSLVKDGLDRLKTGIELYQQ